MFSNYSINETTFVKEALEKRIRIDGRELQQFRKLDISYGNKGGQNITRLGNTAVYSEIESTISTPNSDKPKEGSIRFNVGSLLIRYQLHVHGIRSIQAKRVYYGRSNANFKAN